MVKMALAFYKRLLPIVDDDAAMATALKTSEVEVIEFVRYLMHSKMTREKCMADNRKIFKEQHGCSRTWQYLKDNPEKHQQVVQQKREYRKRRKQEKQQPNSDCPNAFVAFNMQFKNMGDHVSNP